MIRFGLVSDAGLMRKDNTFFTNPQNYSDKIKNYSYFCKKT